ncbi:hypothetical protein [Parapedobacter koreensis]|uniref:Uncharacterized protein n=1 Tax=Parapedobacter koreensis TaxID=332977 RepID=A0A1H7SRQ1_9SPHI|nr:hypothetical protein [Parapedobacter koreensis]SEL75251.1 hypothetical protein SAMN05421740_109153 [Parapedobacter koreensis]
MKKSFGFLAVMVGALLALGSCMRNDDEPPVPIVPISRLYVSFQDVTENDVEVPVDNIALIDPADGEAMEIDFDFNSGAVGGAGIHFSPIGGLVFQSGRLDTLIRIMRVNNLGQLATAGRLGNRSLNLMRGLAYHFPSEMLYVANIGETSHLYGFHQPVNKNGFTRPRRALQLESGIVPWAVSLWNGKPSDDSLLVSNSGQDGGVLLYRNLAQGDSVETNFAALSNVRVEGATSIRGIAFVDSLDVMVMADFGTQQVPGKVYIIEGIKAYLAQPSATVRPTRIISGELTGLSGPIDVAIDPRTDRKTIYVADQTTRKVSRFKLSDSGNVAPEATITFDSPNRTPFSIFLDARGIPVPQ